MQSDSPQIFPQRIVTRQQQSLRQSHGSSLTYRETHSSKLAAATSAKISKKTAQEASIKTLDFINEGSYLNWYDSPTESLKKLLRLVQIPENNKKFFKKDFEYILTVFNKPHLTKLALNILSYLAQYKYKLTSEALKLVSVKLNETNRNILIPTIFTLSYVIENGQTLSYVIENGQNIDKEATVNLFKAIDKLMKEKEDRYQLWPCVIVGLAVKAKIGEELNAEELDFLKEILKSTRNQIDFFPEKISLFKADYAEVSQSSYFRTCAAELSNYKNKVKEGLQLSEDDLRYTMHRWTDTPDAKQRIIHIITQLLIQGQRKFPEDIIQILKDALVDNNRNIQKYAIAAAVYLIKNNNDSGELKGMLEMKLSDHRIYALRAFGFYLDRFTEKLNINEVEKEEWIKLIVNLQQNNPPEKLSAILKHTSYNINGNINELEDLLLNSKTCDDVLNVFLRTAQEKIPLSDNAIKNISAIVKESTFSDESQFNALQTLQQVAENGQEIPGDIFSFLMKELINFKKQLINSRADFINIIILILGYGIQHTKAQYIKDLPIKGLLDKLINLMNKKDFALNACFTINNILIQLQNIQVDIKGHEKSFSKLFEQSLSILESSNKSKDIRDNVLLILHQGTFIGFNGTSNIFERLGNLLNPDDDSDITTVILDIFKYIIEKFESINFSDNIIFQLMKLLTSTNEIIITNSCYILCIYIAKSSDALSKKIVSDIFNLLTLTNDETVLAVTNIIKAITERKCQLDSIEKLIPLLTHKIDAIRINVSIILDMLSTQKFIFNSNHILKLQFALEDSNKIVVENIVRILKIGLFNDQKNTQTITQRSCQVLAQIINDSEYEIQTKIIAIKIMYGISRERAFEKGVIQELKKSTNIEDRILRKQIFACILQQLKFNKNFCSENIENEIIPKILTYYQIYFYDSKLLTFILQIADTALEQGYHLPLDFLESLADILLLDDREPIRNLAARVICKINTINEEITPKIKFVKEIEILNETLKNDKIGIGARLDALDELKGFVEKGENLTRNSISLFEEFIKRKNEPFYSVILQMLQVLTEKGYGLPNSLVELLIKDSDFTNIAPILAALINRQYKMHKEVFFQFVRHINKLANDIPAYFNVLEIGIKSGVKFDDSFINDLIKFISNENVELKRGSAKTLFLMSEANNVIKDDSVLDLIDLLKDINDPEVFSYLCLILKNIKPEQFFDNQSRLEALFNIIRQRNVSTNGAIELLQKLKTKIQLPSDLDQILGIRIQEKIFLDKNKGIHDRINAARKLKENSNLLSYDSINVVYEWLCESRSECKNVALQICKKIQDSNSLEIKFIEKIVLLFGEKENYLIVYDILNKEINRVRELHLSLIEFLFNIMLKHSNISIREKSFFLLKEIIRYQRDGIVLSLRQPLEIEELCLKILEEESEDYERLIQYVEESRSISLTLLYTLSQGLRSRQIDLPFFIQFYEQKLKEFDANQLLPKVIFDVLIIGEGNSLDTMKRFLIDYLDSFSIERLNKLIADITKELLNSKVIVRNKIDVLVILMRKNTDIVDQRLLFKLVNIFLTTSEPDLQTSIIDFIFTYCQKFDLSNPVVLNHLGSLLYIIDKSTPVIKESFINQYGLWMLNPLIKFSNQLNYNFTLSRSINFLTENIRNTFNKFSNPLTYYFTSPQIPNFSIENIHNTLRVIRFVYRANQELFPDVRNLNDRLKLLLPENKKLPFMERMLIEVKDESKATLLLLTMLGEYDLHNGILFLDPNKFCRNILIAELISNIHRVDVIFTEIKVQELKDTFVEFEKIWEYSDDSLIRDNFLESIIQLQKIHQLSFSQVNNLLLMLQCKKINMHPLEFINYHYTENTKQAWLKIILGSYSTEKRLTADNISGFIKLFDEIGFDIFSINIFFTVVPSVISIKRLLNFLNFVRKNHGEIYFLTTVLPHLANANEEYILDYWEMELQCHLCYKQLEIILQQPSLSSASHIESFKKLLFLRIQKLLFSGWDFKLLYGFFTNAKDHVKSPEDLRHMINGLDICFDYALPEEVITTEYDLKHFAQAMHEVAIQQHFFQGNEILDLDSLLYQFKEMNKKQFSEDYLNTLTEKIKATIKSSKKIYKQHSINNWTHDDIKEWQIRIDVRNLEEHLPEILAVLKRASFLVFGYKPRDVQFVAVLALWFCEKEGNKKGRLAQVDTGQGKSLIIEMFAALKSLKNKTGDIITSSPILANRDVTTNAPAYKLFNLTVASNEDARYTQGAKSCYKQNIVYGDASNFEFDILRDEYSFLGTRATRPFHWVIVDEVDNLLIDEGGKIAMLASPMAGMDYLIPLLIAIWNELHRLDANLLRKGELIYYVEKMPDSEAEILLLNIEGFFREKLQSYIQKIISEDNQFHLINPRHLHQFVASQIENWIAAALQAFYDYQEGHHYKIEIDNENVKTIIPVDFANTGINQNGSTWGDGLHQFLQIKHGLKVNSETLITNFISNLAFIKRYKDEVYGFTGTLGSEEAKQLLAELYQIDFIYIPPHKKKQFYELPGILANNKEVWLDEVMICAIREAEMGRVVLIICETMNNAKIIYGALFKTYKGTLKSYMDSSLDHKGLLNEVVFSNTIIVATNLAGRGTDIKLHSNTLEKGGLHVCFTFLPDNLRIELQGFGRGHRGGEPGTGQLILNREDLLVKLSPVIESPAMITDDFKMIRKLRDQLEQLHLARIRKVELQQINNKDLLFSEFSRLLQTLNQKESENHPILKKMSEWNLTSEETQYFKTAKSRSKRAAVEERWGLWLIQCDFTQSTEVMLKEYKTFEAEILTDYCNDELIKNPSYYLQEGNDYLVYANSLKGKVAYFGFTSSLYRAAMSCYDKAIQLDPHFTHLAHYYKAAVLIHLRDKNDYKNKAKVELHKAKKIIEEHIYPQTQAISQIISRMPRQRLDTSASELSQQFFNQIYVLETLNRSIDQMIDEIEHSQKLVDIRTAIASDHQRKVFEKLSDETAQEVLNENAENLVTLVFHDLKAGQSFFGANQAANTVAKINKPITIVFDEKNLRSSQDRRATLKQLLPTNRDVKNPETRTQDEKTAQLSKSSKKSVGVYENMSSGLTRAGESLKKGSAKIRESGAKFFAPVKEAVQQTHDYISDFEKYKKVPVKINIQGLDISTSLHLLTFIQNSEIKVKIVIPEIPFGYFRFLLNREIAERAKIGFYQQQEKIKLLKKIIIDREFDFAVLDNKEKYFLSLLNLSCKSSINYINSFKDHLEKSDISFLETFSLNLCFSTLSQELATQIFENINGAGSIILSFRRLNITDASKIISYTEAHNADALFIIKQLQNKEAEVLLKNADRTQQHVTLNLKTFDHELAALKLSKMELGEYISNGYIYFIHAGELNPVPWANITLVGGLGAVQIAGGVALTVFTLGFGSQFGFGLVAEGVGDIIRALSSVYTRELSISSYAQQKSLSLALSLATAGWSTLSPGAAVMDDFAVQGKTVFDLLKRKGTIIIQRTAKKGTLAVANGCMSYASQTAISQLTPTLLNLINEQVELILAEGNCRRVLHRVFMLDQIQESTILQSKFRTKVERIIHTKLNHGVDTSMGDFSGWIPNDSISMIAGVGYNLGSAGVNTSFMYTTFSKFQNGFLELIPEIEIELPTLEAIFQKKLFPENLDGNDGKEICEYLKKYKILLVDDSIHLPSENIIREFNFGKYNNKKREILAICLQIHIAVQNDFYYETNTLLNVITHLLTEKIQHDMMSISKQLINTANVGLNKALDSLSENQKVDKKDSDKKLEEEPKIIPKEEKNVLDTPEEKPNGEKNKFSEFDEWLDRTKDSKKTPDSITKQQQSLRESAALYDSLLYDDFVKKQTSIQDQYSQGKLSENEFIEGMRSLNQRVISERESMMKQLNSRQSVVQSDHQGMESNFAKFHERLERAERNYTPGGIFTEIPQRRKTDSPNPSRPKSGLGVDDTSDDNNRKLPEEADVEKQDLTALLSNKIADKETLALTTIHDKNKIRLVCFTVMLQNTLLALYDNKLKRNYHELMYQLKICYYDNLEKQYELYEKLIQEKKKILRFLMSFILLHYGLDVENLIKEESYLSEYNQRQGIEIIESEVDMILNEDDNPEATYGNFLTYLTRKRIKHTEADDLLGKLKLNFFELNKLLREKKMLDSTKVIDKVFDCVERKQLGQAGVLLKEGKLGEVGFVVGSLVDGLLKTTGQSEAHHHKTQVLIIKLAETMVINQGQFLMAVANIDQRRVELVTSIKDEYAKRLDKYDEMLAKGEKYFIEGKEELGRRFFDSADKYKETLTQFFTNMSTIAQANAIDPQFINVCMTAHEIIMKSMMETVKALGAQQTSTIQELIKASKEIIMHKPTSNAIAGASTVKIEEVSDSAVPKPIRAITAAKPREREQISFKAIDAYEPGEEDRNSLKASELSKFTIFSFKKGDKFKIKLFKEEVLPEDGSFIKARKEDTNDKGVVPASYMKKSK